MHISLKNAISDKISLSSETGDLFSAVRVFENLTFDLLKDLKDENLMATCQVIGYEIVKEIFQTQKSVKSVIEMQINEKGTVLNFYLDMDSFKHLKSVIDDSGYLRNKLVYLCDSFKMDEQNNSFICIFDGNALNRQLSSDRIVTLKKYLKKASLTTYRFHD